jgi:CheY-like chemotaxis protein
VANLTNRDDCTLKLPATDPCAQAGGPASQTRRILVVDDNRDSADSLAIWLQLAGHEVTTTYDGQDGLQAARQLRPDIVLLDIGLPGLDGYEVARRLREEFRMFDMLLIATTGYGKEEDRWLSQQAGFNAHLVKPVDVDELQEIIVNSALFSRRAD